MSDRHRLNVELTENQKVFIDQLPYGYRKPIIQAVLELSMDLINRHGKLGLASLLAGAVHLDIDEEN